MSGAGSKRKGSNFERLIVKKILEATGYGERDCFRTPLSGGHFAVGKMHPGDVQLSPRLFKIFPVSIEAKCHRTFRPWNLMEPTKKELAWVDQVMRNVKGVPLLVMKGNGGKIYAAVPFAEFSSGLLAFRPRPRTYLVTELPKRGRWVVVLFGEILAELTRRIGSRVVQPAKG